MLACAEQQAERGDVGAEAVVRFDRASDQVRPLGMDSSVNSTRVFQSCRKCLDLEARGDRGHLAGSSSGAPRLAGQYPDYMGHALAMFKAGTRASPIMQPIAKSLSDVEIQPLADYFSKQSAPLVDARTHASPQLLRAGKLLAETGSTSCFECHGPGGVGNGARYPSIAGQTAQFITDRILEFQARAREKAPAPGSMTAVSTTLSGDQIQSAAAYLSHAHARSDSAH